MKNVKRILKYRVHQANNRSITVFIPDIHGLD